jgi:hypothetical protein
MNRDSDAHINTCPKAGKDEIEPFLNNRVILNTNWLNRPLFGIISEIGPSFISLTRKDGRIIKIRRSSILAIEEERREAV